MLCKVALFVVRHGYANFTRDGARSDDHQNNRRIDFGCAGSDTVKLGDGSSAPAPTYGAKIFEAIEDDKERSEMKCFIACILDGMQDCHDEIETKHLGNNAPYGCSRRTEMYGQPMRDVVGALRSRCENLTIQLKCLSRGERTENHRDKRNCRWLGYDKTSGLCFVITDAFGYVWSLKFILNSRGKVGDYLGNENIMSLLHRIRHHLSLLNGQYKEIHGFQQWKKTNRSDGAVGPMSEERPTYLTFDKLVLDDYSPWKEKVIGKDPTTGKPILADIMETHANATRCYFLSPACNVVTRFINHNTCKLGDACSQDIEWRSVELAFMGAYQTNFIRMFHCCFNNKDVLDSNQPSKALWEVLTTTFGAITGDSFCNRLNVSGLKFDKVFLDVHGNVNNNMKFAVGRVLSLLDQVNETVRRDDFTQAQAFRPRSPMAQLYCIGSPNKRNMIALWSWVCSLQVSASVDPSPRHSIVSKY